MIQFFILMKFKIGFSLFSQKKKQDSTKRIRGRKLFIGNGILKQSRSEIFSAQQKDVAVELTEPLFSSPSLSGVLNDKIFLQNLPSMIVAHALKPQPNDLILDMVMMILNF